MMFRRYARAFVALSVLCFSNVAAAQPVAGRENLYATLWMRNAAEYRLSAEQTYRAATAALRDPATKSAIIGHVAFESGDSSTPVPGAPRGRRGAVILDLDETALDNNANQAAMIASGAEYSAPAWENWVSLEQESALPGAVAFTRAAEAAGLDVFYISNRACPTPVPQPASFAQLERLCPQKFHTMKRMRALGFARADTVDAFLFSNERPEYAPPGASPRDKRARREIIARSHDIVMLVGDDLGDFLPRDLLANYRTNTLNASANARVEAFTAQFGARWFLLPNPSYGSWIDSLRAELCPEGSAPTPTCAERLYARLEGNAPFTLNAIRLATWNLEWQMTPAVFSALTPTCTPPGGYAGGADRAIPCNITTGKRPLNRTDVDYRVMRRYARSLEADVIALQETDGAEAAALVFPHYSFCFIERPHVQKTGFAIRPGIPYDCGPHYQALGLPDNSVRWGAVVTLFPDDPARSMTLMSVHLKSGCVDGVLDGTSTDRDCAPLRQQLPLLRDWVAQQNAAGRRFAVMGDFNRDLARERATPSPETVWAALTPNGSKAVDAAPADYLRCSRDETYTSLIDHIVLGGGLADLMTGEIGRPIFEPLFRDGVPRTTRISDHCAVTVTLSLPDLE